MHASIVERVLLHVHESPFDPADMPGILLNLVFASGLTASLSSLPQPASPRRYVATTADIQRFAECAVVLDVEKFRGLLDEVVGSCLDRLAAEPAKRGAYRHAEFTHPDNLPLNAAAALVNRPATWLRDQWKRKQFYALSHDEAPDDLRFPRWQFRADYSQLYSVLELFPSEVNCWVAHHFLHTAHSQLGGSRPRDVISDPDWPSDRVVEIMRARF